MQAGLHRGTVLATADEGRLGYFGATTRIAEALCRSAAAGDLLLTEAIAADPAVAGLIDQRHLAGEFCDLPLPANQGHRCRRLRLT
jgi:class 3 adenylate cyclase